MAQADRYRIALRPPGGAWGTAFSWRRVYRYDADVHPDDHDPAAAAEADLPTALAEFPGHTARVEVLETAADGESAAWRPVRDTTTEGDG